MTEETLNTLVVCVGELFKSCYNPNDFNMALESYRIAVDKALPFIHKAHHDAEKASTAADILYYINNLAICIQVLMKEYKEKDTASKSSINLLKVTCRCLDGYLNHYIKIASVKLVN